MPVIRITKAQRYVLAHMLAHNGISYDDEWNVTMMSLRRKGLIELSRGGKYGKTCWHLTDAGCAEAEKRGSFGGL